MSKRFNKFVYRLRLPFLLAVLVIVAVTSMPADSHALQCPKMCEVDYYYDAARTQLAGHCYLHRRHNGLLSSIQLRTL
jgi:hypothetical protein